MDSDAWVLMRIALVSIEAVVLFTSIEVLRSCSSRVDMFSWTAVFYIIINSDFWTELRNQLLSSCVGRVTERMHPGFFWYNRLQEKELRTETSWYSFIPLDVRELTYWNRPGNHGVQKCWTFRARRIAKSAWRIARNHARGDWGGRFAPVPHDCTPNEYSERLVRNLFLKRRFYSRLLWLVSSHGKASPWKSNCWVWATYKLQDYKKYPFAWSERCKLANYNWRGINVNRLRR